MVNYMQLTQLTSYLAIYVAIYRLDKLVNCIATFTYMNVASHNIG